MKVGEDYFRTICYDADGACPLFKMAGYKSSVTSLRQRSTPRKIEVPGLDASRLEYFAASVFWRASVAADRAYTIDDSQRERWRTYLIGEAGFPTCAAIDVVVLDQVKAFPDPDADFLDIIDFPWISGSGDIASGPFTRSSFTACGFTFRLYWASQPLLVSPARRRTVTFTHPLDIEEMKTRTDFLHEQIASSTSRKRHRP